MIELIKPGTNIDFARYYPYAMVGLAVAVVLAIVVPLVRGVNYGIDFTGGTLVQLRFSAPVDIGQIRDAVKTVSEGDASVQDFGRNEYLVRLPESDPDLRKGLPDQITARLTERLGNDVKFEVMRVETVGPRVGKDLRRKAFLAVGASTLMMGIYVALRFELRFAIGAAAALLHNVLITFVALCLFGYEFDLNVVAALLTIVGFSVNDTVVISDRIRENMRKNRREPLAELLNRSINETLSRTILNSGTVILVALTLYLFGGPMIHSLAFALLVGFIVGTYSSIFVASPIVLYMDFKPKARAKKAA